MLTLLRNWWVCEEALALVRLSVGRSMEFGKTNNLLDFGIDPDQIGQKSTSPLVFPSIVSTKNLEGLH